MNPGDSLDGDFQLEREESGWLLRLKASNGAQCNLYVPDEIDTLVSDMHSIHLHTFAGNATSGKQWRTEGMEGL